MQKIIYDFLFGFFFIAFYFGVVYNEIIKKRGKINESGFQKTIIVFCLAQFAVGLFTTMLKTI